MTTCRLALILFALNLVCALHGGNSKVHMLTMKNYIKEVLDSDEMWFVLFYSPNCGHCQRFAPSYEKAAETLKGIVRLGAVNMASNDKEIGKMYDVDGYPTLKWFGRDKDRPEDYRMGRDPDSLVDFALKKVIKTLKPSLEDRKQS